MSTAGIETDTPYLNDGSSDPQSSLEKQTVRIFTIYATFRLVLSLILLISFISETGETILGEYKPTLFYQTCLIYVGINILTLIATLVRKKPFGKGVYITTLITDILLLAVISNASGGVSSGMAHLLILPIAAGSVLITGIVSIFLAAIGAIAVIYSEIYLRITEVSTISDTVQAGILGFILFCTAVVIQFLSKRIRHNEQVALDQALHIQALTTMNRQIIQRMNTGLIVIDNKLNIITANDAARHLLHLSPDLTKTVELPEMISEKLSVWRQNTFVTSAPIRLEEKGLQLQLGFSYLDPQEKSEVLIFLEDYSRLLGRAQQIKLVSLGRLTASIAHEIRNPLGAISHASQLLNESNTISEDDARLLEIIQNHSKRVNNIIQNILELSRAQKSLVPELIDIEGWLPEFIDTFRSSYSTPIEVDLSITKTELRVRFSLSQLDQVMTNLCENGIHHGKRDNMAHLAVTAGFSSSSQRPYIDIIDEGPGIRDGDEERIFEPFFTTEKGGTGLGLYISREICEAHQAELSFRRTEENKSCFRITFSQPDRHLVDLRQTEQA